jgi:hypothetical protein
VEGQAPEPRREAYGPQVPHDASGLRISDDDRHQVAEVLRRAAGEGRIDLAELDERLEAAYRAKTYGDLVPITADLPLLGGAARPTPVPGPAGPLPSGPPYSASVAVMSQVRRTGSWTVPDSHTAFCLMGSVELDLREAHFESQEVVINATAVMGEVKLVVNAATRVEVGGVNVMGEYTEQPGKVPFDPSLGGPVVRLRGLALMGSVTVQRKGRPGEGRRRELR